MKRDDTWARFVFTLPPLARSDGPDPFLILLIVNAFARHRLVVAACVIIGLAVGIAAGLIRKPTYTATATANAGRLDVVAQAVPGFVEGAQSLATTYSRVATSDVIVNRVARELGLSSATVASRLSATPVPGSPVIRISGQGTRAGPAKDLTNRTLRNLDEYVARLAQGDDDATLLGRYRTLSSQSADLQDRIARQGDTNADEKRRLNAELAVLRLRVRTAGEIYTQARQSANGSTGLTILSRASTTSSDKSSAAQRLGLGGLAGGVLVGMLLGLLLEQRRRNTERAALSAV